MNGSICLIQFNSIYAVVLYFNYFSMFLTSFFSLSNIKGFCQYMERWRDCTRRSVEYKGFVGDMQQVL